MLELLVNFLSSLTGGGTGSLNTKKIDQNIEQLKQNGWFKKIYEDEKYHRLFFTNRHVRAFLESAIRVKRMNRSEAAQKRFVRFLDKQLK